MAVDITVTTRSRGKITGKLQLDKDHSVVFATARTINENPQLLWTGSLRDTVQCCCCISEAVVVAVASLSGHLVLSVYQINWRARSFPAS